MFRSVALTFLDKHRIHREKKNKTKLPVSGKRFIFSGKALHCGSWTSANTDKHGRT